MPLQFPSLARTASPVSAFFQIRASDWGVLAPGTIGTAFTAGGNLTASTTGGSLPTSTGAFKITFVTANGETAASAEATVSVTGATGSVTVSITNQTLNTSTQANAAPIIGWNVYSGNGSGNELRNITSAGLNNQALSTVILPSGTSLTYIPIATTSVQVNVYGTGAAPPAANLSGLQQPLPNVSANSSSDIFLFVNRQFRVYKDVLLTRPASSADAGGLAVAVQDCVNPLWASNTSFSAGAFIQIGAVVFIAVIAGTSTNGAMPTLLSSTRTRYTQVVDNGVTWQCLGEGALIRTRFSNTTGSAGQPTAQEYDVFQE